MGRGLSERQKEILVRVGKWETENDRRIKQFTDQADRGLTPEQRTWAEISLQYDKHWGFPLHANAVFRGTNAVVRASLSRSLRNLETRDLIVRRNSVSEGHKTTNIQLTSTGWDTFYRLTKYNSE